MKFRRIQDRYGCKEAGSYPQWDENHPIHLVGHSYGGNTARVLQQYLEEGIFPGHRTSASWVVSITAITLHVKSYMQVAMLWS